jgi:hypothetical protein
MKILKILIKTMKKISEILTEEQDEKAFEWLKKHNIHVMNLIKNSVGNPFPPTLSEDKREPRIWKAGHWMWYVDEKLNLK